MRLNLTELSRLLAAEYGVDDGPEQERVIDWFTPINEVLSIALSRLAEWDIEVGEAYWDVPQAARLVLLAEAANLAAKVYSSSFYGLKHALVSWGVYHPDVMSWVEYDEYDRPIYSLYAQEVGTASFHDPYDEIGGWDAIPETRHYRELFPWSGVYRQSMAFALLQDKALLRDMAYRTRPRNFPLPVRYEEEE